MMAAVRPRITFTPDDRSMAALERLARVTQQPKARFVTESVTMLADHLENLAGVLEQAKALEGEARASVQLAAETAQEAILPQIEEARRIMSALTRAIDEASEQPPSSNTGATSAVAGLSS